MSSRYLDLQPRSLLGALIDKINERGALDLTEVDLELAEAAGLVARHGVVDITRKEYLTEQWGVPRTMMETRE